MDYLSRGFKSVLGGQGDGSEGPSGSETVERLCDRISSATLLDDRRDAVRAIKSLSKKYRLDVGTKAMGLLINVLQKDRSDAEICGLALEALINILSSDDPSEPASGGISVADLATQFTEIFLKDAENVTILLALLEEYDFRVRWPTVKLLTILLMNRAIQIQQCILVSPLGVSRLMDLLSDSREVIRNDGLLLLIQLTKGNAAIQKIVAFENAFDKLLEIVSDEGYSDGGIVVEDCLSLMSNLFNASNINFFREGSYIQRLVPFFDFSEYTKEGKNWNEQKVSNVLMMLKLVRSLVSPSNPPQSTQSSQKIIHSCNLLKLLCDILMTVGIPAEILTETVNTVAEIIRGNQTNQAFFSVVDAPYNPPKPAIVVLLMSMISDKQPFLLRCAVLYCFQCYLYKNATGQARIISTLLPSSTEATNVTAGQLLCGGLFSPDGFSNWCAATALSHSLLGNKELKEQLLRVQLATGVDCQPVSLLQQCSNILSNGGSPTQTKAAILSLLCNWLSNCAVAVSHFLSNGAIIPFLLSCVDQPCENHETIIQGLSAMLIGVCIVYNENDNDAFTAESIKRLITTRIDPEHFLSKINNLSKVEAFTSAAKHTQIPESEEANVLFDHEFTKQFKKLEVSITRVFLEDEDSVDIKSKSQVDEAVVSQYKELIREQDEELSNVRTKCKELQESYDKAQSQLEQQAIDMVSLRNEVALYKNNQSTNNSTITQDNNQINSQISILNDQLKLKEDNISQLQNQLELSKLSVNESSSQTNHVITSLQNENTSLKAKMEELHSQVTSLMVDKSALKTDLEKAQNSLFITQASLEVLTTNKQLNDDVSTPNQMSRDEIVEYEQLKLKVIQMERENEQLKASTKGSTESKFVEAQLRAELAEKTSEYTQQKQDYEDLLVLLEDQDSRIKKLKLRLRELGENIANESTDEDDDDLIPDDVIVPNDVKNESANHVGENTAAKIFHNNIDLT